jgi:hypothetical protein
MLDVRAWRLGVGPLNCARHVRLARFPISIHFPGPSSCFPGRQHNNHGRGPILLRGR